MVRLAAEKSTIAEVLSQKYDLHYFKVDDYLDKYMKMGSSNKKDICSRVEVMTPEQIWMRKPLVQCEEELLIYEEIFEFILEDLKQIDCKNGIITEGAAYLPKLENILIYQLKGIYQLRLQKNFRFFITVKGNGFRIFLQNVAIRKRLLKIG